MHDTERPQLSFDVGGRTIVDMATIKVTGTLKVDRDLPKGSNVQLRVIDADGAIVAAGDGYIAAVTFKDHRDEFGDVIATERAHNAKLQS